MIVMNVGGGNSQGLSARRSELLCEIVVSDTNVDSITGPNNVCDTVGSCENPLGSYESPTAEILVERVNQGDLPAPFAGNGVLTTDYTTASVGSFHSADILVGDNVARRSLLLHHMIMLAAVE